MMTYPSILRTGCLLALLVLSPTIASSTSLLGSRIGGNLEAAFVVANGGNSTYAMAANNTGWDARFVADSAQDVLAITVTWTTVTSPGQFSVFIETDNAAGKPSGTLYDAAATKTAITPTLGTQTVTFDTPPSTGLTPGATYHVVLLITTLGTAHTLASHTTTSPFFPSPTAVLQAADGTTRTNFAVVSGSFPHIVLTREGGAITSFENHFHPFNNTVATNTIYLTNAVAAKLVTEGTLSVTGYFIDTITIVGTPAGNLRIRLYDSSDATVTGSTVTIDKDVVITARGLKVPLDAAISLPAGTYRMVLDSAVNADTSNCFNMRTATAINASAIPNATKSTTADISANPPTWADTATQMVPMGILFNSISAPASSRGIIGG